jgi:hypothetical protein
MAKRESGALAGVGAVLAVALGLAGCDSGTEQAGGGNDIIEADNGGTGEGGDAGGEGGDTSGSDASDPDSSGPMGDPEWRIADLGELTQWNDIESIGIGLSARYVLVGTAGAIAIYDGEAPSFRNLGLPNDLRSVYGTTEEDLIVCGTDGLVRHWDAVLEEWQFAEGLPVEQATTFTALAGSAPDDVYVGGDDGQIWRFNGNVWVEVFDGTGTFPAKAGVSDIYVSEGGTVYIGAGQTVVWGQGTSWQSYDLGRVSKALHGFPGDEVFAVTSAAGGTGEFIHHLKGGVWAGESANSAAVFQGLNGVWGPTPDNVFAIGFKGTLVRYWDGGTGLAWGPVSAQLKDEYALKSSAALPAEEQFNAASLTLRSIHGVSDVDILVAVEGLTGPDGGPTSANLLHYRAYPLAQINP